MSLRQYVSARRGRQRTPVARKLKFAVGTKIFAGWNSKDIPSATVVRSLPSGLKREKWLCFHISVGGGGFRPRPQSTPAVNLNNHLPVNCREASVSISLVSGVFFWIFHFPPAPCCWLEYQNNSGVIITQCRKSLHPFYHNPPAAASREVLPLAATASRAR